ncbi:MAG: phytanoyl-CoA dioxygenase family protein [Actinomycetota bacterium]
MSTTADDPARELGWAATDRDDPAVQRLRDHLAANNGLAGLEVLEHTEIDRAVRLLERDGFVVIGDVLDDAQTAILKAETDRVVRDIIALDDGRAGNRGSHRYSFGGSSRTRSMLHEPAWQMLLDLPRLTPLLEAAFRSSDYLLRAASGDFCLPGATEYQPLHSDMRDAVDPTSTPFSSFVDPRGFLTTRDLPMPYLCVNFLTVDMTALNGPTRQIPGTQHSRAPFPTLSEEPEWMRLSTVCPAPAGSVMLRDVRAWHGGTPNLSEDVRSIPNLEIYAPWFREPMIPGISRADWEQLSPRAQAMTRYAVADSSETLDTGYFVKPFRIPSDRR